MSAPLNHAHRRQRALPDSRRCRRHRNLPALPAGRAGRNRFAEPILRLHQSRDRRRPGPGASQLHPRAASASARSTGRRACSGSRPRCRSPPRACASTCCSTPASPRRCSAAAARSPSSTTCSTSAIPSTSAGSTCPSGISSSSGARTSRASWWPSPMPRATTSSAGTACRHRSCAPFPPASIRISSISPRAAQPEPFLLAVSTLHPHKNLDGLLRAFAIFRERHPEYRLIVSGIHGFFSPQLHALRESLQLAGSVEFPGWIPRERSLRSLPPRRGIPLPEPLRRLRPAGSRSAGRRRSHRLFVDRAAEWHRRRRRPEVRSARPRRHRRRHATPGGR